MCPYICPISTNTKFVILIHPMEFKKIKNGTGVLTKLQLKNSEIVVGLEFTSSKRVNELVEDRNNECYILYPGEDSINISRCETSERFSSHKQRVVFILDATWPCAKKMMKLSKNLQDLPFISFENNKKSEFSIKQQPHELCLSTIESVQLLLDEFNRLEIESVDTNSFLGPFKKMVEYQVACVLNPNNNNHHRAERKTIRKKEFYKTNPQRALFFDKSNF